MSRWAARLPEAAGSPGLQGLALTAAQGGGADGGRVLAGPLRRGGWQVDGVGCGRCQVREDVLRGASAHGLLAPKAGRL